MPPFSVLTDSRPEALSGRSFRCGALLLQQRSGTYYKVKGVNLHPIHDLKKLLPIAKKSHKYAWLANYDSMALQESLRHLSTSFDKFYKKEAGFSRFKSHWGRSIQLSLYVRFRRRGYP